MILLDFGQRLPVVPARALLPYEGILYQSAPGCPGARSGCPGAHFRLPESTIQVAREHDSGCPGTQLSITLNRLPGSTLVVAREHVSGAQLSITGHI